MSNFEKSQDSVASPKEQPGTMSLAQIRALTAVVNEVRLNASSLPLEERLSNQRSRDSIRRAKDYAWRHAGTRVIIHYVER